MSTRAFIAGTSGVRARRTTTVTQTTVSGSAVQPEQALRSHDDAAAPGVGEDAAAARGPAGGVVEARDRTCPGVDNLGPDVLGDRRLHDHVRAYHGEHHVLVTSRVNVLDNDGPLRDVAVPRDIGPVPPGVVVPVGHELRVHASLTRDRSGVQAG